MWIVVSADFAPASTRSGACRNGIVFHRWVHSMSTQTILGHSFPTPCKRCGGALYRQVDYCPYCGAVHPLDAGPHKRAVIPGSRASAMNKTAQKNELRPGTAERNRARPRRQRSPTKLPLSSRRCHCRYSRRFLRAPIPPLADPPHSRRAVAHVPMRQVLSRSWRVVAIGLAYVAYALFSDNHDSQNGNTEQTADNVLRTPERRPARSRCTHRLSRRTRLPRVKPAAPHQSRRSRHRRSQPRPSHRRWPHAPVKPATPQFRDAAQALQAARLAFRANDLSAAQAALGAAQTLQPGNADAQNLATRIEAADRAPRRRVAGRASVCRAAVVELRTSARQRGARDRHRQRHREDDPRTRDSRDRLGAAQAACRDRQSGR